MDITREEAEQVIETAKIITEELTWNRYIRRRNEAWKLSVSFQTENGDMLKLIGNISDNYSFALIYKGKPIRKYTVHTSAHTDPKTEIKYQEPHKHTWDDQFEDKCCYIPDDISLTDINDAFLDFIKECKIDLQSNYNRVSFSTRPASERQW